MFPGGQLWISVTHEHGSNRKTLAHDLRDVSVFLDKLSRFVDRVPKLRDQRKKRERAREEEWERRQAQWKREEEQRQQWREQQERLTRSSAISSSGQRRKAFGRMSLHLRPIISRLAGAVEVGGFPDGWRPWGTGTRSDSTQ